MLDTKSTSKIRKFSKISLIDVIALIFIIWAFTAVMQRVDGILTSAQNDLKTNKYEVFQKLAVSSYEDIESIQENINYKNASEQFDKGEISVKSVLDDVNDLSKPINKLKLISGLQNSYKEMPGVLIIDKKDNIIVSNENGVLTKICKNYFPIIESENQKAFTDSNMTDAQYNILNFTRQLDSQKIAILNNMNSIDDNFYCRAVKLDNPDYKAIMFKEKNKSSALLIKKSQLTSELIILAGVALCLICILTKFIYILFKFRLRGMAKQLRQDYVIDKCFYICMLYKQLYKYPKRYVIIFNSNIAVIIILIAIKAALGDNSEFFDIFIASFIIILIFNIIIINVETAIDDIESGDFEKFKRRTGFGYKRIYNKLKNINEGYDRALNESLKSERLKTELITNVSHDLKTPLTSIINYVNILKTRNITDEERNEYLDILDRKTNRLKNLIFDLFEVSKLSSGKIELNKVSLDLVELLNQCVGESSTLYSEKNLEVKVTSKFEKLQMEIDGEKMSRVFENLIVNAYKYAMKDTRIYIDINENLSNIIISFKNVSCYEMNFTSDEVFERFARGDKARTSKIEGSGLGMAIAKSIVELHGGRMKVDIEGDMFKVFIYLNKNS